MLNKKRVWYYIFSCHNGSYWFWNILQQFQVPDIFSTAGKLSALKIFHDSFRAAQNSITQTVQFKNGGHELLTVFVGIPFEIRRNNYRLLKFVLCKNWIFLKITTLLAFWTAKSSFVCLKTRADTTCITKLHCNNFQ